MDKYLPRNPNPSSQFPSWMQKGVHLRGVPNEKDLELNYFYSGTSRVEEPLKRPGTRSRAAEPLAGAESAEQYLALIYMNANEISKIAKNKPNDAEAENGG